MKKQKRKQYREIENKDRERPREKEREKDGCVQRIRRPSGSTSEMKTNDGPGNPEVSFKPRRKPCMHQANLKVAYLELLLLHPQLYSLCSIQLLQIENKGIYSENTHSITIIQENGVGTSLSFSFYIKGTRLLFYFPIYFAFVMRFSPSCCFKMFYLYL